MEKDRLEDFDKWNIVNKLVGNIDKKTFSIMKENLECFFNPVMTMFIPVSNQCPYAVSEEHIHFGYMFTYSMQSVMEIVVEGEEKNVEAFDNTRITVVSPYIAHSEKEVETFQSYIAIVIEKEYFEKILLQYLDKLPIYKGEVFGTTQGLLDLIRCFMMEYKRDEQSELLSAYVKLISHELARGLAGDKNTDVKLYNRFEINRSISYMRSHLSEKLTLEILAANSNLSPGHYSKLFHEATGYSPMDFLHNLILETAKKMLISSKMSITEIALNCGFTSSSYFPASFQKKYHVTPSSYRKKIGKK